MGGEGREACRAGLQQSHRACVLRPLGALFCDGRMSPLPRSPAASRRPPRAKESGRLRLESCLTPRGHVTPVTFPSLSEPPFFSCNLGHVSLSRVTVGLL